MAIEISRIDVETTTKIDTVDTNTTYVGEAKLEASTADAFWQILKITKSGTETSVLSANGNLRFNNKWTERASLSYL